MTLTRILLVSAWGFCNFRNFLWLMDEVLGHSLFVQLGTHDWDAPMHIVNQLQQVMSPTLCRQHYNSCHCISFSIIQLLFSRTNWWAFIALRHLNIFGVYYIAYQWNNFMLKHAGTWNMQIWNVRRVMCISQICTVTRPTVCHTQT